MRIFIVIGLMATTVAFQNCAQTNFSAGSDDGSSTGQGGNGYSPGSGDLLAICNKTSFETVTKKLKILLVVDNSGSVLQTDPQSFRQASIQNLITKYAGKANFSWQIVLFNGTTARALINKNGNVNDPVFSNAAAAQQALEVFKSEVGVGNTPYLSAISMAEQAIRSDADLTATDALYVTMFMSDGQPTDAQDRDILAAEKAMLDRAPSRITFNSLYFGKDNSTQAINRLKSMSDLGKGLFTNITTDKVVVNIDDISVVPGSGCIK